MRKPAVSVLLVAFVAGCGDDFDDRPPPDADSGTAGSAGAGGSVSSGGSSGAVSSGGASSGGSSGAGGSALDASAQGGASGQGGAKDAGPDAAPDAPCASGTADCDKNPSNGCEISTQDNAAHCGGCNKVCPDRPHADTVCNAGACSFTCQTQWDDCDKVPNNGCEVDLGSVQHCGACGNQCSTAHGQASCSSGACAIACDAGWGNCDASNTNGCETDLTTSQNCGACGHDCESGVCANGECGPVNLATLSETAQDLASYQGDLFATTSSTIVKISKSSGTDTTLANGQKLLQELAVDGSGIYFTDLPGVYGTVSTIPLNGGAVKVLASGLHYPGSIDLDSEYAYWSDGATGSGRVRLVAKAGGNYSALAVPDDNSNQVMLTSTDLYWTDSSDPGAVRKVPKHGGAVTQVATGQGYPWGLTQDTDFVYWTNEFGKNLMKYPKAGGSASLVATVTGYPSWIAAHGQYLFYANQDKLMRIPKAGGTPTQVVDESASIGALISDGTRVFWATGKSIRKLVP